MLAYQFNSPHIDTDEIKSSSSSSVSIEYPRESLHLDNPLTLPQLKYPYMIENNQAQSTNLIYPNFGWDLSNRSSPFTRDSSVLTITHFPDLPTESIYWSKQLTSIMNHCDYDPECLRTKSCSPPSYAMDSLTHKHARVKSASARLMYAENNYKGNGNQRPHSPLVSNSLDPNDNLTRDTNSLNTQFLFNVILNAPTAVMKKTEEESITYLNRNQSYLFNFEPSEAVDIVTSVITIAFHEQSHRKNARDYWRFWISQQEDIYTRAIDLDSHQSTGIFNMRLVSFDRISFDWHSRHGAKVFIRFNCLSTDFSRIKGVKGIPMRVVVESTITTTHFSSSFKGNLKKSEIDEDIYEYKESCYCKIKLFRDKGAERKNKDDIKQKQKQIDKLIASTHGSPEDHPLWPIMNQTSSSQTALNLIPTSPDIALEEIGELDDVFLVAPPETIKRKRSDSFSPRVSKKNKQSSFLTVYVWTRHLNASPRQLLLDTYTSQSLKNKLAAFFFLQPQKVSEILWRRKQKNDENSEILVLIDDTFISEHIKDGEIIAVDWELKQDGSFRMLLDF